MSNKKSKDITPLAPPVTTSGTTNPKMVVWKEKGSRK